MDHPGPDPFAGPSLAPFRVGSVPYLNTVPLTRGLEDQILYAVPSKLAEMLQRDELDAALVSIVEVLASERYDILDGVAIASLGEVKSVLLAHRRPLDEVKEVFCDPASLTSVALLRVLLAERGLRPEFKPLESYDFAALPDFALLIGDRALDLQFASQEPPVRSPGFSPLDSTRPAKAGTTNPGFMVPTRDAGTSEPPHEHELWDLGSAWYELTRLPFVYAVWALRRGVDHAPLRRELREAKDFGMETLDAIIRSRPEYTLDFRKDYLGWHIHYHLADDERRGIARFIELLRQHGLGPVYAPRYVR